VLFFYQKLAPCPLPIDYYSVSHSSALMKNKYSLSYESLFLYIAQPVVPKLLGELA
jgi:hypothetical protein